MEKQLIDLHRELKDIEDRYNIVFVSDNYHKPMVIIDRTSGKSYYYETEAFEIDIASNQEE
ncbi:hypothetical protein [Alkalicoccus luteus]|uniref:Uncharacterized protein n=1 Tax=Alkalicoccus luteus TaxID=1237094 RepID=A0A969TX51_9BACI|nr:hypothetical protein [Alkalicoccus luteus]NJP37929.1 hypothetical protein [Alkalicoccus luteus]